MRHDTTNGLSSTTSLGVATPPRYVYVFGDQLGPRPLVILDQSQQQPSSSSVSDASKSASPSDHEEQVEICGLQKYEPMLQALNWEHGVLYIPLSVAVKHHKTQKCEEGEGKDDEKKKGIDNTLREDMKDDDVIGLSCEQVRMVLDMLDIRWTHYLTYSYGALVAARMASSPISRNTTTTTNTRASLEGRYAHRIGTVLLLDTPLITGAMLENFRRREELKAAEADVNVPHQALSAAKARLLASLEPPLPTPCRADQTLFHQYLFEPSVLFPPPSSSSSHDHPHEAGGDGDSPQRGLRREDRRYVPLQDLLDFSHPIDLIVPAEGAVADVPAFKEVFGVRRPSVVKSAKLSASSSSSSAAEEKGGTPVGSSSPSSKSKSKSKASSAAASPTGEVGGPGEDHPTADATRTESVLFECMDASHGDSSTATAVATEMAQLIRNWMLRYEPDAYIQRQFQQAVTEMKQLLSAGSSAGGEVNAKENTKEKKKKEKKKKK